MPLLTTLLGFAFIELFVLRAPVPSPWATAPDLERVEARGTRLVLILIDGMNASRAFDPNSMPFLAGQRAKGAWGVARAQVPTLTGSAVTTLGTGRWTTLLDAIYNFQSPPSQSDSLFRRLDDAGRRAALIGDGAWASRFGPWADVLAAFPDHGIADTHRSDDASTLAFKKWLAEGASHSLVVMHWVGADHAGHAHGTGDGSPYAQRLRELDAELQTLCALLPADVSVLVVSDHGMTPSGGHGGAEQETRDAPFVWWGPGVRITKPLTLTQAVIAPTVAAYLGVITPAEAAEPPAAEILDVSPAEAEALKRNHTRQRRAVETDTDGQPMTPQRPGRTWVWIGLCAVALAVGLWAASAGGLLGVLGAGVPLLRWLDGHLWVYGAILVGVFVWALRAHSPPLPPLTRGAQEGGEALTQKTLLRALRERGGTASVPGSALLLLGVGQQFWPQALIKPLLIVGAASAIYAAHRKWPSGIVLALLTVASALYGGWAWLQLLGLVCTAYFVTLYAPPPTRLNLHALPLVLMAWEVFVYYALGKDYSLSAVQVALAFALDAELHLAQAIGMIALGEWLPWGIGAVIASQWLNKTPALWRQGMTALGLMLPLQLAALVVCFGWVQQSFWFLSSSIPFMIGLWVVSIGWPLSIALALPRPHPQPLSPTGC